MREIFWIDVRSPREFAHSHYPNALNFPVLNDKQYEEVGTLYHQNTFEAKRLGSAYICQNIALFLQERKEIFHPKHKLILYCARGGQRSKSLWIILSQIGFDCERMEGGYKSYRQNVLYNLSQPPKQRFITLYGLTGCGKSEMISSCDEWSIDIEKLAKHYGSSFGDQANGFLGQPTQAMFENLLFAEFEKKQEQNIWLVEGESKKLGKIVLPTAFFQAYQRGLSVWVDSPIESRVQRIVKLYAKMQEKHFLQGMQALRPYLARNVFDEVLQEWQKGEYEKVALVLLEKYYDKVYRRKECDVRLDISDFQKACENLKSLREEFKQKLS